MDPPSDHILETACLRAVEAFQSSLTPGSDPALRSRRPPRVLSRPTAGAVDYAAARLWELTGFHERALDALKQAIIAASGEDQTRLYNALVRCATQLGREAETASWLEPFAAENPAIGLWSGHLFLAARDPFQAAEALERCVERVNDPALRRAATDARLRALLELGRLGDAIDLSLAAIGWFPEDALALRADLAGLLTGAGRHEDALAEAERVLAADPSLAKVQFIRGAALVRLGRTSEGTAALEDAVQRDPTLAEQVEWLLGGPPG